MPILWVIIAIVIANIIAAYGDLFQHISLISRPIFIGFVTGLLLGDIKTGILIGAELELAFLGIVYIGATTAADPAIATIMTVALSILNNLPAETVIPLGMTIGYVASALTNLKIVVDEFFTPAAEKALSSGDEKKFSQIGWGGTMVAWFLIPSVICVLGVVLGGDLLEQWFNSMPAFVLTGIGAAGAMLPALGIAMILSLLLSGRMAIYFLSGFVIYKYLGVDMIFMLVIGLLIALGDYFISAEIAKIRNRTTIENAEEDFLS